MITRRGFLAGLMLVATTGAPRAAETSAQDFLAAIYATYKGKDAKGIPLTDRGVPARYFTPALARMIEADARAAAKRGEVGNLDGDPFIDGQDFDISAVAIDVKDVAPNKALGTVKLTNFGKETAILLDLAKLKDGWRIDDIRMPSGSLRAVFKKK